MIQRIQTIFLLLASAFLLAMFLLPLAELVTGDGVNAKFIYRGFVFEEGSNKEAIHNFSVAILLLVNMILSFFSIFLYKRRILQIRVNVFNMLLMIGLVVLIYFSISKFTASWDDAIIHYKMTISFPIASIILSFLAIRAIGKDEALIRSTNRIR